LSEILSKIYIGLHVNKTLFQSNVNKFSQRIFEQFSNMKFHENPSKKEPSCSMRRGGQADTTNLAVAFVILQKSLKMNFKQVSGSKHFLFFQHDAHRYKIIGILKQLKFQQFLRHVSVHTGTIIRELFRA